jgi:hypothetical protein
MHRPSVRLSIVLSLWLALAHLPMGGPIEASAGVRIKPKVTARLTGWVARGGGYHLYRPGATARMVVRVWPNLRGEQVRAVLEWRRAGIPWRRLDRSTMTLNGDSTAVFVVRRLPAGFSFRMRARVPPTPEHRAGRSPWRYFRAR